MHKRISTGIECCIPILLVLGLTILMVIPFSFTVLVALWTFLIVKLAALTSTAEEEPSKIDLRIENPMNMTSELELVDPTEESESESELDANSKEVTEEVVEFTARPLGGDE